MDQQTERVAAAFSRKAVVYDEFGHDHENLTRMRRKVYAHIGRWAPAGSYLLELNAGTGLDAAQLATQGYRLHATDIAPGMLTAIEQKIQRYRLQDKLTSEACSFTELERLNAGPFDGVISNSGGLNCIADLSAVTRQLPAVLKPGGFVTWVIMPPICPWELMLTLKDWRVGTRRLRPGGVMANVEGVQFRTHYFSAQQVVKQFGPQFEKIDLEALSLVTPTADNKTFSKRMPRLYRQLVKLDDILSRWPLLRGWGDFFILTMRYKGA